MKNIIVVAMVIFMLSVSGLVLSVPHNPAKKRAETTWMAVGKTNCSPGIAFVEFESLGEVRRRAGQFKIDGEAVINVFFAMSGSIIGYQSVSDRKWISHVVSSEQEFINLVPGMIEPRHKASSDKLVECVSAYLYLIKLVP